MYLTLISTQDHDTIQPRGLHQSSTSGVVMKITTFYTFVAIENSEETQHKLEQFGLDHNLKGLILVAPEGINGTISGDESAIDQWKSFLVKGYGEMDFKDSYAETHPFKRWLVKIRKSIVNLGIDDIHPNITDESHITPDEWNKMVSEDDVVVIDTRNTYETEIGKFKGAIDPEIKTFSQFPEFVKNSQIPKDKPVLMYCTGGIRCEKAMVEMKRQGYEKVFQLKGGILQYMHEHPNEEFEGECFVFDQRVSVDQNLKPSEQYGMCPHTGDPATIDVTCEICGTKTKVRHTCDEIQKRTCSKNCAYQLRRKLG